MTVKLLLTPEILRSIKDIESRYPLKSAQVTAAYVLYSLLANPEIAEKALSAVTKAEYAEIVLPPESLRAIEWFERLYLPGLPSDPERMVGKILRAALVGNPEFAAEAIQEVLSMERNGIPFANRIQETIAACPEYQVE